MLTDATYAGQNTQNNRVVYFQLAVATIVGTEHHLVKQHEDIKNGYGSWKAFCECYYGGATKNETSGSLKSKFGNLPYYIGIQCSTVHK